MRPFETYLRLLLDLHVAMKNDNEDEADVIRDKMDGPWWNMSADERALISLVSATLYEGTDFKGLIDRVYNELNEQHTKKED